jgi:hypothetical protein
MTQPIQVRIQNLDLEGEKHTIVPVRWANHSIRFMPSSNHSGKLLGVMITSLALSVIGATALTLIVLGKRGVPLGKLDLLNNCSKIVQISVISATSVLTATWISIAITSTVMRRKATKEVERLLSKGIELEHIPGFHFQHFKHKSPSGYQVCHLKVNFLEKKAHYRTETVKDDQGSISEKDVLVRPEKWGLRNHYYVLVHDETHCVDNLKNYLHFFEDKAAMENFLKAELQKHDFIEHKSVTVEIPKKEENLHEEQPLHVHEEEIVEEP